MSYHLPLASTETVANRVHRLTFQKPDGFDFKPGQAIDLALDREGWRDEPRPFTMTSLPADRELEFHIKEYPDHEGVTQQLGQLREGAWLSIGEPWGAITDQGPGLFVAGGMGITPFLAILRARARAGDLAGCTLIYGVDTPADLVAAEEFSAMADLTFVPVVSEDARDGHRSGRIDADLIGDHLAASGPVYLCGPPPMEEAMRGHFGELGVGDERVVHEE